MCKMCTHTHTHEDKYMHTHMNTHTHMHTNTDTHIHTYTHIVQTDTGEKQRCLTELFGEEKCLQFAF